MPSNNQADIATKDAVRKEFAALTEQYLAGGGQIQQLSITQTEAPAWPPGSEVQIKKRTAKRERADDVHRSRVIRCFGLGMTVTQIMREAGYHRAGVERILEAAGLKPAPGRLVISNEQLALLREFADARMTESDIAALTGVPRGKVREYLVMRNAG